MSVFNMSRSALLVCLALSALSCRGSALPADERIVGGVEVDIKDYPYQLSLISVELHTCGAAILSEYWALTAAHCVSDPVWLMKFRAGSSTRGGNGTIHHVAEKVLHEAFSWPDYDIAVLRVEEPFVFGEAVSAIRLPELDQALPVGANARISGWGTTSEDGFSPRHLHAANVTVLSTEWCQSNYVTEITERMFCAGVEEGGIDSCQGDSGGPLEVNGEVLGVVSWGKGCALPGFPTVYANVANLRGWIREHTGL